MYRFLTTIRCLCELARQIGFSESADDIFERQLQLSTYRHVVSIKLHKFMKRKR